MDGQSEKQKIYIQPVFELVEGGMNEYVRPACPFLPIYPANGSEMGTEIAESHD